MPLLGEVAGRENDILPGTGPQAGRAFPAEGRIGNGAFKALSDHCRDDVGGLGTCRFQVGGVHAIAQHGDGVTERKQLIHAVRNV
ncbi:hypothetical protein D9M72_439020 [compost metagenome]